MKKIHKKQKNSSLICKGNSYLINQFVFSIVLIEKKVGKNALKTFDYKACM
jgi:hypothetical protein